MQVLKQHNHPPISVGFEVKGIENKELLAFISKHLKGLDKEQIIALSVDNKFSINNLPSSAKSNDYQAIVNIKKANDVRDLTNLYCAINNRLEVGGIHIHCLETAELRKERLMRKFPAVINSLYYSLDYLGKRVIPKLPILSKLYHFLTAGRNRVLTLVEVLGRFVYCGFDIVETRQFDNLLYIVVRKESIKMNLTPKKYGVFFKMERTGQYGTPITVYKVRTMYAYSEYLQEYIYENNSLAEGGKFKNDYRINFMGRIMRKLWLDELPMVYNLLKGEVKFIGVRPLSKQYLSLYSEEARQRRQHFKPGLIPPYYADLPETIDEIIASEMNYFSAYEKNPLRTDLNYFGKALKNIIFKKARSN